MELHPQGEGSSFRLTFILRDSFDEVVIPTTAKYRIDCLTTRTVIRDWTALEAASEILIVVEPADNVIKNDRNKRERRQLTVVANDDEATQWVDPDPLQWWVDNVLPNRSVLP